MRTFQQITFELANVGNASGFLRLPLFKLSLDLLHDVLELRQVAHNPLSRLGEVLASLGTASRLAELCSARARLSC